MYDLFIGSFLWIIPMHLTLMAGVFVTMLFLAAGIDATPVLLVIFLGLTAYVDIRMHRAKHAGKMMTRSTALGSGRADSKLPWTLPAIRGRKAARRPSRYARILPGHG
jgi:hypothetical protein